MALWAEVSGWFGAFVVLAGYAAFSMNWVASGKVFQLCNLAGSAALLINGAFHGAWPSVALNLAWGAIAAVALARYQASSVRSITATEGSTGSAAGESLTCPERRLG